MLDCGAPAFPSGSQSTPDLRKSRLRIPAGNGQINILDPQQQPPALCARHVGIEESRQCMAEGGSHWATGQSGKRVAWLFYLSSWFATPIAHDLFLHTDADLQIGLAQLMLGPAAQPIAEGGF
jgi:hypothetical protein